VDFAAFGEIEKRPLSRLQGITASVLSRNWVTVPHVTHNDDIDITALNAWRVGLTEKPSQLALLVKALVSGLKAFPYFNASLDGDQKQLVLKKYFHIGIAIDTPRGLVVGVVRDCDRKSAVEVTQAIGALGEKARGRGLPLSDMEGGCMSISSLGGIGGTSFTPIVNAPEVAILGITRSEWKPRRGADDTLEWRLMAPMSLSYDHRVINGADAARFLRHLDEVVAAPQALL
jgi:pyruvate dehydrogenase E2 component (dihydrolipoamide acetyltransferase)